MIGIVDGDSCGVQLMVLPRRIAARCKDCCSAASGRCRFVVRAMTRRVDRIILLFPIDYIQVVA